MPQHVTNRLRAEIQAGLAYTKSLSEAYDLVAGPWVLYALYNDQNEIVGTFTLTEDRHSSQFALVEFVAIREDYQKQGLGRYLMEQARSEVAKHSSFSHMILATGRHGGPFYCAIGMQQAGVLMIGDRYRDFYIWPVDSER